MSKLSRNRRPAKVQQQQQQLNLSADDFRDDPLPKRSKLIERQSKATEKENQFKKQSAGDSRALSLSLKDPPDLAEAAKLEAGKKLEAAEKLEAAAKLEDAEKLEAAEKLEKSEAVEKLLAVEKTINGDPVVQQLPDCPFCGKDFRCWIIL
jgi:hypothetical protein